MTMPSHKHHVHALRVRGHRIYCDDPVIVAGGIGHDVVTLDASPAFDGLRVTIVLDSGEDAVDHVWDGEPWEIPASVISYPRYLPVSVVGRDSEGAVRVTTERCDHLLRVEPSGDIDGSVPAEDQPDVLAQILSAAEGALRAAEEAGAAADEAREWSERAQNVVNVKRATQVTVGDGMPKVGGIAGDSYIDYESGNLWSFEERQPEEGEA